MNKPFLIQRRVQFCETDLAGVLHFANYYRFMEEAEHEFLRSVDLKVVTSEGAREISWPRVATSCEYFAPCRFDDVVELAVTLLQVGDRSVTYEIEFRLGDKRIAVGKATAVCCAIENGKFEAIKIPDSIRSKLTATAPAGSG